jgi:ParB family chromosome partitioning protein
MGHARALLALNDPQKQLKVFNMVQSEGLSVRKVEEAVKALNSGETVQVGNKKIKASNNSSELYALLKEQLSGLFRTRVQLQCSDTGKGKITIPFSNESEMERIIEIFDRIKIEK